MSLPLLRPNNTNDGSMLPSLVSVFCQRLRDTCKIYLAPALNLHRTILVQVLVHIKSIPEQMRLMSPALLEAFILCTVNIFRQDWLVVWMCALLDDLARALLRRHPSHVCKTLLCYNDVEIMLARY